MRAAGRLLPRGDKQEAFFRLALAHAQSAAGDAMVTVSLAGTIFFTTSLNQARPKLVLSLLLTLAPFAVVAPFLGPAIDRSRGGRRLMIVASAAGRAVVCLYMATVVHSLMLYPCALAILILSKTHAVAKSALVPATVDSPAEYVRAGGRLAVIATVAGLLGALPAALVWKAFDASWSLRLAAIVYAGAAVMAVRIRPAPPAQMDPPDHVDEEERSRGVSLAATCMITLRACSGFLTFAVAFILRREAASAFWYGLVGTGALVGGFLGNVIGPRLRTALGEEKILTLVLAIVATGAIAATQLGTHVGLAVLAFGVGLADGIGQLAFDAIVQRDGSEGSRGRSFARFEASFQLAWVGAALVPVVVRVPTWVACVTMAAATGSAAIAYFVGRHTLPRTTSAVAVAGGDEAERVAAPRGFYAAESPPVRGFDGSRRGSDGTAPPQGPWGSDATAPPQGPWVDDAPTPPLGTQPVPPVTAPAPIPPEDRGGGPRRNPRRRRP